MTTTTTTTSIYRRTFVSKSEKRVLTQQQVGGPGDAASPTTANAATATPPRPTAAKTAASTNQPPEEASHPYAFASSPTALGVIAVTVLGGGVAYYLRFHSGMDVFQGKKPSSNTPVPPPITAPAPSATPPAIIVTSVEKKAPEPVVVVESVDGTSEEKMAAIAGKPVPEELTTPVAAAVVLVDHDPSPPPPIEEHVVEPIGNRVTSIHVPPKDPHLPLPDLPKDPGHPEGGNRVAMSIIPKTTTTTPAPTIIATAQDAAMELDAAIHQEAVHTLHRAQQALKSTLEDTWLQDLDHLTPTQLRIRIVQLAKELQERTKWEAVRLKEFLAMKEDETADRYVIMIWLMMMMCV
jgi:mitofilin